MNFVLTKSIINKATKACKKGYGRLEEEKGVDYNEGFDALDNEKTHPDDGNNDIY